MKTKNILNGIILLILLGLLFLKFIHQPENKQGKKAPNIETKLVDGSPFKLSDLRGQYVLLDFWGSWCPPCRRDNPNLVALYNTFHGKTFSDATNFDVVTVALEKNDKQWAAASKRDGFIWKHQIVQQSRAVLMAPLAIKYSVSDVPSKFLIGPDGDILFSNPSKQEISDFLTDKLK